MADTKDIQNMDNGDRVDITAKCLSTNFDHDNDGEEQTGKIGSEEHDTFYKYPHGSLTNDKDYLEEGEKYRIEDAMVMSTGGWNGILIRSNTKIEKVDQDVGGVEAGRECVGCGANLRTHGEVKGGGKPELGYKYVECSECGTAQPE